ncbi:BSD domain-containing protein 1 [Rhynchospora pubera]|uniref:BSD domain-containing protein 1 n=1 Tax=Rhynchospora pubera TaxID=906938 RepID=A0AAV8ESY7_9POAL|nr:BSD domain-containing protein 1 [Rhynchospora pubera]
MNFFRSVFSPDPDPDLDLDGEDNATSSDHDEPDETAQAASAAAAAAADFFKSVFSTSPDPPEEEDQEEEEQTSNQELGQRREEAQEGDGEGEEEGVSTGPWGLGLGGLIKTFASRSETVIKDLEEFGHGLRAETVALRDVASRALDVGASAAQERLESMGQAVDDIGDTLRRGTAEIISQSKEALLSLDAPSPSSESPSDTDSNPRSSSAASSLPIMSRYTRFEAQLIAARSDPATFTEPPEDPQDFAKWQSGFKLEEQKDEIDSLLKENSQVEVFLEKLVPNLVDEETFWSRYFYKIEKIKQAEDARAKIVKMAVSGDEEEDLSWDVEEEEEEKVEDKETVENKEEKKETVREQDSHGEMEARDMKSGASHGVDDKERVETSKDEASGESNGEEMASKSSDFSVISSRPSVPGEEEEDLGWEAIEEVGETEEKIGGIADPGRSSGAKAEDLRKRLSATVDQEEEELSWDIEDEEEGPAHKS